MSADHDAVTNGRNAGAPIELFFNQDHLRNATFGVLDCCPDYDYSTQCKIGVAKNSSSGIP